jgi:hypothetical protein
VLDAVGPAVPGAVYEVRLTGLMTDGTQIVGSDCLIPVIGRDDESSDDDSESDDEADNEDESRRGKDSMVALDRAFPNPFNPVTTIRYSIPSTQHVRVLVYDVAGTA